MYSGKFSNEHDSQRSGRYARNRRPSRGHKRIAALMVSLLLLVTAAAGGTLAYLTADTTPVENNFTLGKVPIEIQEDFDGSVKQNVCVENTGNIDAFVRARVVINWQTSDGRVFGGVPQEGTDYNIKYGDGWFQKGEYWYCREPVAPNGSTAPLIVNATPLKEGPEGGKLDIQILTQSIQADGVKGNVPMATGAWGVTVSGGKLVP